MAGVNSLQNIYRQKGEAFMRDLFEKDVIITEQIPGSYFGFMLADDGHIHYFKKDSEITKIYRLLTKFYDKPIAYIESLPAEIKASLPVNNLFVTQYLPDGSPKPRLFIQYLHNKAEKTYMHKKEDLDPWADTLGILKSPILFQGKLSDDQKSKILEFVYASPKSLENKFKAISFTQYLLDALGASMPEYREIGGVVFRFYDGDDWDMEKSSFLAKVIDPVMADMIKSQEIAKSEPNDYFYLITIDLMSFIESYPLDELMKSVNKAQDPEDNYISLVNKVYLDFIEANKTKYLDVEIPGPKFLEGDEFDVNLDLITNDDVKMYLIASPNYKEIYKILLNSFRKKKRNAYGIFTPAMVLQFNRLVGKIANIVTGAETYESQLPSFYEVVGSISEDFNIMPDLTLKDRFSAKAKMKRVNILIDHFYPITNSHVRAAQMLYNKNRLQTVFVLLTSPRSEIKQSTINRLVDETAVDNSQFVADVIHIESNTIDSVITNLHPNFQPVLWGTGKSTLNDYLLQLDYAHRRDIKYSLDKGFKLVEISVRDLSADVLNSIRNNDYEAFKRLTPPSIHFEFFNLRFELQGADK